MIAVARVAELLRGFGAVAPVGEPRLSIADNGDNTGARATVSAAIGSANTVYVQSFAGDFTTRPWQAVAWLNGSGSAALNLAAGHYFGYALSSFGGNVGVSAVSYFVVTDGLEALYARCLAAVQAKIRLLLLAGLSSDNVVVQKLPLERHRVGGALPAIVLSPHRSAMPSSAGTNSLDDVNYDVLVTMLDRDNQEASLELNLDRHLLWRQQIARAFRNQRLIGVPEVINAAVEPAEGILSDAWKHELMASALLLRFTSRESRGFG
jgi:hypothetical protein